jgi:hypothetical protein
MLSNSLSQICKDLERTNKAIVAIGCSFVQGSELNISCPKGANVNEYKNSRTFVNVLCKLLNNQYTPINLGQEAAGNFAAISRLFLYNIPWSSLDEIIIIFMPTGMQRFDIIKDDNESLFGYDFKTVYPFMNVQNKQFEHVKNLSIGYEKTCYSEKFEVLNCIQNFQFLNSWIKNHNAKLIVFPAFGNEYNKDYFTKMMETSIFRNNADVIIKEKISNRVPDYDYQFLIDQVPWNNFLNIDGSRNFFDLCFKNDKTYDPKLNMYDVMHKNILTNNDWIMPRGHPSVSGHKLLASELHKILSTS